MRSILLTILVGVILVLLSYISSLATGWQWHQVVNLIGLFLTLLTILTHQINLYAAKQEGRAVITPYLISTVLKLILSGGFLFVLVKFYPEMVKVTVINFLIYYAIFSGLEIILVNRRLHSKKF